MLSSKVCKYCKVEYSIKSSKINSSKYCSKSCFYNSKKGSYSWNKGLTKETDERVRKNSESLKLYYKTTQNPLCGFKKGCKMHLGRKLTDMHKKKIGDGVKLSLSWQANIRSKDRSLKLSKALKGRIFSTEWKDKISESMKGKRMGDENPAKRIEVRRKIAESKLGKPRSLETRKKLSITWKEKWKNDTVFVNKWIKSQNLRPNKKEQYLIDLFKREKIPFNYVGDFKYMIGRKCPDFINKYNNQIIEFFGNHWHTKEEEKEKINYFKEYGYDCLVIWQSELNKEEILLNKIRNFAFISNINAI